MNPTQTPLTLASTVTRSEQLLGSKIDNELVMMDMVQGNYYALNPVASHIWDCLAAPVRITDLCAALCVRYAVAPDQCQSEVLSLLADMQAKGMVTVSG